MDFKITPYYYIQYIETLVGRRKSKRGYSPHNSPHTTAATAMLQLKAVLLRSRRSLVSFVLVVFFVYNASCIT